MSDTDPIVEASKSPAPEAYGDKPLAETTQVLLPSYHVPGAALETVEDHEANEAKLAEPVAPVDVPAAPLFVESQDPVANLNSRTNIVPSGPGSVEDFIQH